MADLKNAIKERLTEALLELDQRRKDKFNAHRQILMAELETHKMERREELEAQKEEALFALA